ncbi:MAG: tRNA (guanosine(46)-N7)-methyltransferase TrmB [Cyanophyceae cyanobacterium]
MSKARVRQHVNPLSQPYQVPVIVPDWTEIYPASQPLHLDIGSAKGKFLLQMAQLQPQKNFLGVEIRKSLVLEANLKREHLELPNLYFLFCNVNVSLNLILSSLPTDILQIATIQFPDPWFKHKHVKRRVVQPELVEILAQYLVEGGFVFLQSDVQAVAQEMSQRFNSHRAFQKQHQSPWLAANPLPVPTEREQSTLARGEPIYRSLFSKSRA